jgi:cation diffusion facilitator CzcD-associated flavoprotein CzcO
MPVILRDDVTDDEPRVGDHPQCSPTPLKIIHVGCGAAGMLFAHKIRRWLTNYELVIYEKNPVPGGTWYENRYPGCACDVPSHAYSFTFEPNPEWSGFYSYADEIQQYMLDTARKWAVDEFTQYRTEVLSARWMQHSGMWELQLRQLGVQAGEEDEQVFTDTCHVLVNGSGVVNKWKWPDIDGLHEFQGTLAHSAAWDSTIDWAGKSVAVIGSGSSSIQMVPPMAETAKSLTVFIRNPTYVGPLMHMLVSNKETDPDAQDPGSAGIHRYTDKEKKRFREDPDHLLWYRRQIEKMMNGAFPAYIRGSAANLGNKAFWQGTMEKLLAGDPELGKFLIPDWSPGCRRLSPGEHYLQALLRDNVTPCTQKVTRASARGIITADEVEHQFDIIACATGFAVQYLPHFRIVGVDGEVMQDQATPNVYASVSVPGFPNYFVVNGPRGNWGQGCALPSHETQIEYILQCCKKIQDDHIEFLMPKRQLTTQLNVYMDAWHRHRSIWAEDCKSWYKVCLVQCLLLFFPCPRN